MRKVHVNDTTSQNLYYTIDAHSLTSARTSSLASCHPCVPHYTYYVQIVVPAPSAKPSEVFSFQKELRFHE